MKSSKNRSERAEAAAETKDTTKSAEVAPKKKKKNRDLSEKAEKKLTEANVTKAAKDEVTERVTKYIYPADVKSSQAKKEWRRKHRAKMADFTKKLNKLKKSTNPADEKQYKTLTKEFNEWKQETLTEPA